MNGSAMTTSASTVAVDRIEGQNGNAILTERDDRRAERLAIAASPDCNAKLALDPACYGGSGHFAFRRCRIKDRLDLARA